MDQWSYSIRSITKVNCIHSRYVQEQAAKCNPVYNQNVTYLGKYSK